LNKMERLHQGRRRDLNFIFRPFVWQGGPILQTKARIRVIKADGAVEDYLHTKVLATINNCMTAAGHFDILFTEEFAEVITYHLYKQSAAGGHTIGSDQIFAIVKAILCSTGFDDAAEILTNHQLQRKLRRGRIEVLSDNINDHCEAQDLHKRDRQKINSRWNKSKIVSDLVEEKGLERQLARVVAGAVEEKVLNLQLRQVSAELIRQIVIAESAAMLCAQSQLQSV
jgi:hypothetical protein